jgi:hypothetical protein
MCDTVGRSSTKHLLNVKATPVTRHCLSPHRPPSRQAPNVPVDGRVVRPSTAPQPRAANAGGCTVVRGTASAQREQRSHGTDLTAYHRGRSKLSAGSHQNFHRPLSRTLDDRVSVSHTSTTAQVDEFQCRCHLQADEAGCGY